VWYVANASAELCMHVVGCLMCMVGGIPDARAYGKILMWLEHWQRSIEIIVWGS